jgi:hypothetical protein
MEGTAMKTRTRLGTLLALGLLLSTGAHAANVYVVPSGSTPTPPYSDWSIAATNIQTAVNYAGTNYPAYDTVVISNGTYNITNQIEVTNALTVRSFEGGLAGAEKTIVQRSTVGGTPDTRVFYMTHAQAVLEGLTIRNGFAQSTGTFPADRQGSGVWMSGGTVRNCVIRDQVVNGNNWKGSGIYITGGTVSNCVVRNNSTGGSSGAWGAGLYVSGSNALVTHSVIASNSALGANDGGGVYLADGAKLRNSLVQTNTSLRNGGGVYLTGSNTLVESCTIVGNAATNGVGGGVYRTGGSVSNSIVYLNIAITDPNYSGTNTAIAYSCTAPLVVNTGNIAGDPLFVNAATNDFRLQKASPCVDAGLPPPSPGTPYTGGMAWVNSAVDLAGQTRYQSKAVDMGAYETYVPLAGTGIVIH